MRQAMLFFLLFLVILEHYRFTGKLQTYPGCNDLDGIFHDTTVASKMENVNLVLLIACQKFWTVAWTTLQSRLRSDRE